MNWLLLIVHLAVVQHLLVKVYGSLFPFSSPQFANKGLCPSSCLLKPCARVLPVLPKAYSWVCPPFLPSLHEILMGSVTCS